MKTKLRPGWVLALLCTVLFFYGFYLRSEERRVGKECRL